MTSVLPSLFILGLATVAAICLARWRSLQAATVAGRVRLTRILTIAVIMQGIHFIEEAVTGFHLEFPALLGLPPMPLFFFVTFNLLWLAIWIASVPGLRRGNPFAFFAAWFLAIAGTLNGIGHPLMASTANSYFPGLLSSPLIGVAGLWLLYRLWTDSAPISDLNSRLDER